MCSDRQARIAFVAVLLCLLNSAWASGQSWDDVGLGAPSEWSWGPSSDDFEFQLAEDISLSFWSTVDREVSQETASLLAFVGVHRTGDFIAADGPLHGGLQTGFRAALEVMHSEDEGLEFVVSRFGGERRETFTLREIESPESSYQTTLWNGEVNFVSRETVGEHRTKTILGLRVLSTNENLQGHSGAADSRVQTNPDTGVEVDTVRVSFFSHLQTLDTRLLALQLGWDRSFSTQRFDFSYGLRTALGVGHHAYFERREDGRTLDLGGVEPVNESIEQSDFDVATVAEYYLSASYRLGERLSLTTGLYRISLVSFDNPSTAASADRFLVRHVMGVNVGASYAY
ncbi:MAG: hypothetical protein AAFX06_09635 [Planctomycetota bacterium]